jgi:hypothetical protein
MSSRVLLLSALVVVVVAGVLVEGRDLSVTVVGGHVERKDRFTSDPYMRVTVCNKKYSTPVISLTTNPVWNWTQRVTHAQA